MLLVGLMVMAQLSVTQSREIWGVLMLTGDLLCGSKRDSASALLWVFPGLWMTEN